MLGAAIVGAAARRQEQLGTALELVLVARDSVAASRCRERFLAVADGATSRYGATFKLIVYDLATARAMWRTRTDAATRDVRDAELLAGTPLADLLSS
jgi:hypothetical protein